jgi:DNA repair protein RadC
VIAVEDLLRGTLDGAHAYTREVVRSVLQHGSAAVILFHNHSSGVSEPSPADHGITRRIRAALQLIDVRVLDHLIVADPVYSFSEAGLL